MHINHGWEEEKRDYALRCRSSYCPDDIVELFEQFKYFSVEWQFGVNKEKLRIKGVRYIRYYWETTDEWGELVRVVCDLPERESGEGIIVTVFKP